ncbi:MAG: GLPGLI family protein [Chitinophagaceae bacterium]|nr:GLPGLI family protein [Chitinophagaceae bacterium]
MKSTSFLLILILLINKGFAQNAAPPAITFKGKITFERKLNQHKQMDEMMKGRGGNNAMADNLKKNIPKYKSDIFELIFTENESIYKPAKDGISESKMMFGGIPAEKNVIYNNYVSDTAIAQKNIFEKTYLIKDSLKKYNWKITEDFRKIAGFNCRRAETVIMDSVYVVAFYTDAILADGGPEGFNGLPGMILGIVMPRLNITYFATKVDNFVAYEKEIVAPAKGEKKNYAQMTVSLKESLKQWGDYVQRIMWFTDL